MMNPFSNLSRREALRVGALVPLAAAGLLTTDSASAAAPPKAVSHEDPWRGLKIGVASYTLRQMPLEAAIKAMNRTGLKYVSVKDSHLPRKTTAAERQVVAQKFKEAGLTALSCGNIGMTADPANIRSAFEYARDAGIPVIVCSPNSDSFPILDQMVKEFDIRLAIHNHGPEDKAFPSPYEAMKAAEKYDRRIGVCIDVGHTARAGVDPAEAIVRCRERLYDVHLKDIHEMSGRGRPIEVGRGVLDIAGILQALRQVNFSGHVGFEYEKDAADPLPGLTESVGYVRGTLARL
jgi:sugar phosphate isomerase/epimerase